MTHDLRIAALLSFLVGCSGSTGTLFQAETADPPVASSDSGGPVILDGGAAIVDEPDSEAAADAAVVPDAGAPDAHLDAASPDAQSPHDSGPSVDAAKCDPLIKSIACGLQAMASNGCGDYYDCTNTCGVSRPDASDDPSCAMVDGGTGTRYACSAAADMPPSCTKIAPHLACCPTPRSGVPFVN